MAAIKEETREEEESTVEDDEFFEFDEEPNDADVERVQAKALLDAKRKADLAWKTAKEVLASKRREDARKNGTQSTEAKPAEEAEAEPTKSAPQAGGKEVVDLEDDTTPRPAAKERPEEDPDAVASDDAIMADIESLNAGGTHPATSSSSNGGHWDKEKVKDRAASLIRLADVRAAEVASKKARTGKQIG